MPLTPFELAVLLALRLALRLLVFRFPSLRQVVGLGPEIDRALEAVHAALGPAEAGR